VAVLFGAWQSVCGAAKGAARAKIKGVNEDKDVIRKN
jgi:hypothetical protein